jgi:hypothetical protein
MICGRCEARISKQLPGAQDGFVERQENGLIGGSRGCCQSLNSGNITGYRASPRPARPVFTNPIHLAEKPAARTSARCQLALYGCLDERIIAKSLIEGD